MAEKKMGAAEKAARQDAADIKMQQATERAYTKALTTTEANPKNGLAKGELGKPWADHFKK